MKLSRQEAEDFLFAEAGLLDDRRFEEWLDLFTEDGIYWIPMDENADPEREPSVLYDTAVSRAQRVYQLLHQPHYSQLPPSRTIHFISNVEVDDGANDSEIRLRCNVLMAELRPGDTRQAGLGVQRSLACRCDYLLRYERQWRIAVKKVLLINRDLALENFTIIV